MGFNDVAWMIGRETTCQLSAIESFEAKQNVGVCAGESFNRDRRTSKPAGTVDSHSLDVCFGLECTNRVG
jgi:hypothetical protein